MAFSAPARLTVERIPLADIRQGDDRFGITLSQGTERLEASIDRIGLLNPILVLQVDTHAIVVSGRRRAAACAAIGWTHIAARILPAGTPKYECACRAVGENALERPLRLLETARALALLDRCHPEGTAPSEDAAALGLPSKPELRVRLKALTQLPAEVQSGIAEEAIAFPIACELGSLEPGEAVAVSALLRRLNTGLNKQREILQLTLEIARREQLSPCEVVADPALTAAVEQAGDDPNRATRFVRQTLRRRRFPAIDAAENRFERLRRQLTLGEGLSLEPPRDFEGSHFHLGCRFERVEDLERLRDRLERLIREPALAAILQGKGRGFGEPC